MRCLARMRCHHEPGSDSCIGGMGAVAAERDKEPGKAQGSQRIALSETWSCGQGSALQSPCHAGFMIEGTCSDMSAHCMQCRQQCWLCPTRHYTYSRSCQ